MFTEPRYWSPPTARCSPFAPSLPFYLLSVTLPFTPRSTTQSLCFRSPHQNFVCISLLPHACHMSHPSLIILIIFGDECKVSDSEVVHGFHFRFLPYPTNGLCCHSNTCLYVFISVALTKGLN